MAQFNTPRSGAQKLHTHEGAVAMREGPIKALERVLFAHFLWEDSFYVDGKTNADALRDAVHRAVAYDPLVTQSTIMRARTEMNIRHASLLAAVEFARVVKVPDAPEMGANMICGVIQRADELAEVLALAGGKGKPRAVKVGVARAFAKFDEYQLGKYKGEGRQITLKDAVFLSHPDPKRVPLVQKIVDGTLATPETWEVQLSAGGDKKEVFEGLLRTNKLGAMALLRNLRNMYESNVDENLIAMAFERANWSRVLPFRFMSAALTAPRYVRLLDSAFRKAVAGTAPLTGRTAVLLDTSGSMATPISAKSQVHSYQAGACLAAAVNGDVDLYQWADSAALVANWQSLSTALSIRSGKVGFGTQIGQAIRFANAKGDYDRLIVITDMQFADTQLPGLKPEQKGYTINTAAYTRPGLLHGRWTHLSGWSDAVLKFIAAEEGALNFDGEVVND